MTNETAATGPLSDIRVIDLSRILAGPYAAQILGDFGAEVIKIERRDGDDARRYGAFALPDVNGGRSADTAFYLVANRNKYSVTLEIGKAEGRDILLKLLETADVLIENFKVGTMQRFGLDYATLRERFPKLVYCSLTGYGQTGPNKAQPGYDAIFQAQSGMMSMTGLADGQPGGGPMKVGPSIVDIVSGMNAAMGIILALYHRKVSGQGQYIDIALYDSAIAATSHSAMEYLISGQILPRLGNEAHGGMPGQTLRCRDGILYLNAGPVAQFTGLCRVMGLTDLLGDPRYKTALSRSDHRDTLTPLLEKAAERFGVDELARALADAGVPVGVVNTFDKVFSDPQVIERGMQIELPHPVAGHVSLLANPVVMSETPAAYRITPPQLGEHTNFVLSKILNLSDSQIADLRNKEVI